MKGVKTLIIILGVIVLGILGYYFITSMQNLDGEQTDYQFTEGEEIIVDDYDSSNEGFETETELEAEIESQESQEAQAEAEFNELEEMDF